MSERIVGRLREMALRDPVVRKHLGGLLRGATTLEDALFYTVLDLNDKCERLQTHGAEQQLQEVCGS